MHFSLFNSIFQMYRTKPFCFMMQKGFLLELVFRAGTISFDKRLNNELLPKEAGLLH